MSEKAPIDEIREWVKDGNLWCSRGDGLPCAESRRALAALEEAIGHCDRGMLGMFQRQMHESILAILRGEQQEQRERVDEFHTFVEGRYDQEREPDDGRCGD